MTLSTFALGVIPGYLLYTILQHYALNFICLSLTAFIDLLILLLVFTK